MASTGERVVSLALVMLVLVSAVGGAGPASPVGTVSAQAGDGSGGPCDSADWFLTLVTGTLLTTDCKTAEDVAQEWNETEANETRVEIHARAAQLDAGNEQYLIGMENALTDSNTIAFSKGEAAAVQALANGSSISEAQQKANESIDAYYAVKQQNLIDRYNVNMETLETMNAKAENTSGVNDDFVTLAYGSSIDYGGQTMDGYYLEDIFPRGWPSTHGYANITTVNGSNASIAQLDVEGASTDSSDGSGFDTISNGPQDFRAYGYENSAGDKSIYEGHFTVSNNEAWVRADRMAVRPDSAQNLSGKSAIVFTDFYQQYMEIENRSQTTKEEVAVYVNQSLGPAMESGDLDAENYVSPSTLAQEYAQDYNGSKSYIQATATAAYAGMETPDLNQTASMTISYNNTTYEGLLLSQNAPSGGWQSGATYDPSNITGLQMFAVAGNDTGIVPLDQPFTVDSITGTDNEELDKATTINVTYETSNETADYAELQNQIRSLNQKIEERQAQATGGGSDTETNTDGWLSKLATLLGVSSGVAVVIVAGVGYVAYRVYVPDS